MGPRRPKRLKLQPVGRTKIMTKSRTGISRNTIRTDFNPNSNIFLSSPSSNTNLARHLFTNNINNEALPSTSSALDIPSSPIQFGTCEEEASSWKKDRDTLSQHWRDIAEKLCSIFIQTCQPVQMECMDCGALCPNIIRCNDCPGVGGVPSHLCHSCYKKKHQHLLHMPDVWSDLNKEFKKMDLQCVTFRRSEMKGSYFHQCDTQKDHSVTVIDDRGFHHLCQLQVCKCESQGLTVARYGFWPLSLDSVKNAVTIPLLETLRSIQLETAISTSGFCSALKSRFTLIPDNSKKLQYLADALMKEPLDAYRNVVTKLKNPLGGELTTYKCPPCHKAKDKVFAVDGCLQLLQLNSSGKQSADPYHSDTLFYPDDEVQKFLCDYERNNYKSTNREMNKECNSFSATNVLHSKAVNANTKIKGVIDMPTLYSSFSSCLHLAVISMYFTTLLVI